MGAWTYMEPRLRALIEERVPVRYIGRPERSSPAEGSLDLHQEEQARIVAAAFEDAPPLPATTAAAAKPARASATAAAKTNGHHNGDANGHDTDAKPATAATAKPASTKSRS
jgi:hypothetical protein